MNNKTLIIIPFMEKIKLSEQRVLEIINSIEYDMLFIDDRNDNFVNKFLTINPKITFIKHEVPLGYGACFVTGYSYARDFEYDIMMTISPDSINARILIDEMEKNIIYGYDIVSCSRLLENYGHNKIAPGYIQITEEISQSLNKKIENDITDPLSEIKAYRLNSLKGMELTEFGHGILLQIWIQSSNLGLLIIELPHEPITHFGRELDEDENSLEYLLSLIETEAYLYNKGKMN